MLNIIIGKRSNLSNHLLDRLDEAITISSLDALDEMSQLDWSKLEQVNLILNQFQTATRLDDLSSPFEYINNAISSTASILEYIKDKKSKFNKIIYTSSSSVYGNNKSCAETDAPQPLSLHAALKLSNEKLVSQFCSTEGLDYTITRVFNMYGGNDKFSIVSKIIKAYQCNASINLINDGRAVRDFIYIGDVVEAYKAILSSSNINLVNVASGNRNSVSSILKCLQINNISVNTSSVEQEEINTSIANNSKLMKLLKPRYRFDAVEDYVLSELQK